MSRHLRRTVPAVLLVLTVSLSPAALSAQSPRGQTSSHRRSPVKRALFTLLGAGAGFGAGLWFGLSKFDDAIDSDRKVWTSMIVGAVAGGAAGYALSGDRAPTHAARERERNTVESERLVEVGLQIFEGLDADAEARHAARHARGGELLVAVPVLRRQHRQ